MEAKVVLLATVVVVKVIGTMVLNSRENNGIDSGSGSNKIGSDNSNGDDNSIRNNDGGNYRNTDVSGGGNNGCYSVIIVVVGIIVVVMIIPCHNTVYRPCKGL